MRTYVEDGRIKEDRACSNIEPREAVEQWACTHRVLTRGVSERDNKEPRGAVEEWVCAHRVHTRRVSERDTQRETKQKRGVVETRQRTKARTIPEGPTQLNLEIQAQLKTPVKKERAQGAYQASRREAAKTVAKFTTTRGVRHLRIKREGDDITSLTLDKEGTREAQTRRPNKVNISLNPTCEKVCFLNFTRHKATCTRHEAACRKERADLLGKERENGEITRRLKVRRRDLLLPKALLAMPQSRTEHEECDEVTKERRRICRNKNPTARETVKSERDKTLTGVPVHEKTISVKGEASNREGRTSSKHKPAIHNTKGEEQPKRYL